MNAPAIERPPVSVIVPFAGTSIDAARVAAQLGKLPLRDRDELIVVDNSASPTVEDGLAGVQIVRASRLASSYYARNAGAERAANEWLLFVDSDCLVSPGLIDGFFDPAPGEGTGLVAGAVEGDPTQTAAIARYHRSRGHLRAEVPLETGPSPAAGTANLLVRRAVWEALGGFREVTSGADFEFSWRAGERGWEVEHRSGAAVMHLHPDRIGATLAKARRYGAGQHWLERLYPGAPRQPGLVRELIRAVAGIGAWTISGQFERARFKALDAAWIAAYWHGWFWDDNIPRTRAPS